MKENPNVIAFSLAKRALVAGTRERHRMISYTSVLTSFHVIVFTRDNEGYPTYQEDNGLHIYATNSTSKIGMIIDAYKIGKRILEVQPEKRWVLSAQDPFGSSVAPLLLSRYKNTALQIQVHGDVFNKYFFTEQLSGFLKRGYAKWVLARADRIRVVSERIKQSLLKLSIPGSRIVVLPIQADIDGFLQVGSRRPYEESKLTKFLFVGRLASEKNIGLLLSAFSIAKAKGMVATLSILGDGPLKSFLEAEVSRLGIEKEVTFLPWTDKVSDIMSTADIFCLSSLHEGYAMVLLEAMAAGLPMITTDVGCVGSVVIDGEVGRVILVGDSTSYANAMQELAEDKKTQDRFGRAGYSKAQTLVYSDEVYLQAIRGSFIF